MLTTAAENFSGKVARPTLRVSDATTFRLGEFGRSEGFDRIMISYAISMIPEWEKAVERALLSLAPGGSLHIVDFGQQEHLPVWFRNLLQAWLTKFHVTPRANLRYVLETLAGSHNASLDFEPLARGYAWRAVLTMPKI